MTTNKALLAALLLLALVSGLVLLSRWFVAHRAMLVEHMVQWWQRFVRTAVMQRLKARYPRLWKFLAAFAHGEYLGLHLTVGLAISLVGLWIFAALTEDVVHQDPITRFDQTLLDWLRGHAGPGGLSIARAISALGSAYVVIGLALRVGSLLAIRRQGLLLEGWITAFLGGAV